MSVEVFVVPDCGRCQYFKNLLRRAGIEFAEVDVSAGLGGLKRLRRLSGLAQVPGAALGDRFWPALTPDQAQAALASLQAEMGRE